MFGKTWVLFKTLYTICSTYKEKSTTYSKVINIVANRTRSVGTKVFIQNRLKSISQTDLQSVVVGGFDLTWAIGKDERIRSDKGFEGSIQIQTRQEVVLKASPQLKGKVPLV